MKGARVQTVVRVPIATIVDEVVAGHTVAAPFVSVRIEGDSIVLTFGSLDSSANRKAEDFLPGTSALGPGEDTPGVSDSVPATHHEPRTVRRSRRSGTRNRMKTRGWNVVTKTKNSHGQTVTIYEPFVKALAAMTGPHRQKEKVVGEILRANGNKPGPESIRYYLENTLEYLARQAGS